MGTDRRFVNEGFYALPADFWRKALFAALLFGGSVLILLVVWKHQEKMGAKSLIASVTARHDPIEVQKLADMLDARRVNKPLGDEALRAIFEPILQVRNQYLLGSKVYVLLGMHPIPRFRRLVLDCSEQISAGNEIVFQRANSTLFPGTSYIRIARGLDSSGRATDFNKPGEYGAVLMLRVKILPAVPTKLVLSKQGTSIERIVPHKTADIVALRSATNQVYSCVVRVPIFLRVSPRAELDKVQLISNDRANDQMARSISIVTNAIRVGDCTKEAIELSFTNIAENFPFTASIRDAGGSERISQTPIFPLRAGHSGSIALHAIPDLFPALGPGSHKATLVLQTREDYAYEFPGLNRIWNGTLSYPVQFTVSQNVRF